MKSPKDQRSRSPSPRSPKSPRSPRSRIKSQGQLNSANSNGSKDGYQHAFPKYLNFQI